MILPYTHVAIANYITRDGVMGQFSAEMAWSQQTPCCLVSYLTYCPKHKLCDNM